MMEILDASALLALFKEEPGALMVKKLLLDAENKKYSVFIHQINYIEVVNRCIKLVGELATKRIIANVDEQLIGVSNYMDGDLASSAMRIKTLYPISLADALGLAYTQIMDGRFWTADKLLKPIAEVEGIRIQLIR